MEYDGSEYERLKTSFTYDLTEGREVCFKNVDLHTIGRGARRSEWRPSDGLATNENLGNTFSGVATGLLLCLQLQGLLRTC